MNTGLFWRTQVSFDVHRSLLCVSCNVYKSLAVVSLFGPRFCMSLWHVSFTGHFWCTQVSFVCIVWCSVVSRVCLFETYATSAGLFWCIQVSFVCCVMYSGLLCSSLLNICRSLLNICRSLLMCIGLFSCLPVCFVRAFWHTQVSFDIHRSLLTYTGLFWHTEVSFDKW